MEINIYVMDKIYSYLLMEVIDQSKIRSVEISENNLHFGYEPQSDLELKEPEEVGVERLIGTLRGKAALHQFKKGDLVAVNLSYRGYKEDGEFVNHIIINDIKLVKELDYLFL
jgi:hypothetical protein